MPIEAKPYLKSISILKPEGERLNSHPFNIPAISQLEQLEFHRDVTFLVGENGSGKSTLLEAIAMAMDLGAQGGTGNFSIDDPTGLSELYRFVRAKRSFQRPKDRYFLRAESFFNVGKYLEDLSKDPDACTSRVQVFQRYGGKSLHHRSHGESFLSLINDAFSGKGLYIFDEPEAALSPSRQLAALVRINDLVRDESQFIIATHSPILMSYPRSRIYLLDNTGFREVAFEETEHFKVTRDFLNNVPQRLKHLLSDTPLLDLLDNE
jgi:predicted ATPase